MLKVSVIIPVYNVEQYLRECLDSVAAQTLKDIEIICINDGSTDSSPNILREYAAADERFVVINKKNEGYGRGMNDGLDAARGEYVGIVESDDYVPAGMFEELYTIAKEKDLDIIKGDFYRFYDEDGERRTVYERTCKDADAYNRVIDPWQEDRAFVHMLNTWTGIYKRSFLEEHHIRHNETPGASFQDNGFWFQTFAYARRVYFVDKAYYMNRRDNPDSSVKQKSKIYCINDEYKFIHDFLDANPDLREKFIYAYSRKRILSYFWNYGRIAKEAHSEYVRTISAEIREAVSLGEIDFSYFRKGERLIIKCIARSPWLGNIALSSYRKAVEAKERRDAQQ